MEGVNWKLVRTDLLRKYGARKGLDQRKKYITGQNFLSTYKNRIKNRFVSRRDLLCKKLG